jgi:hypothetical protein
LLHIRCYVDDCAESQETEEQALDLIQQLIDLSSKAGMVIQKFYTNSPLAVEHCDKSLLAKQITSKDKTVIYDSGKVLGITFSADKSDSLQFIGKFNSLNEWTNRKGDIFFNTCEVMKPQILELNG